MGGVSHFNPSSIYTAVVELARRPNFLFDHPRPLSFRVQSLPFLLPSSPFPVPPPGAPAALRTLLIFLFLFFHFLNLTVIFHLPLLSRHGSGIVKILTIFRSDLTGFALDLVVLCQFSLSATS